MRKDAFCKTNGCRTVGGPDYDFGDHWVKVDRNFTACFYAGFVADVGDYRGCRGVDCGEATDCSCAG